MNWYKEAKFVQDPKLMEAARRVVDENKSIRDMVEEYRIDIEELGDEVVDLRKMRALSSDKIAQAYDEVIRRGRPWTDNYAKSISKITGLPWENIVWVLRRIHPELAQKITPEEKKEIIKLRESGEKLKDIIRKTRIGEIPIRNVMRERNPDSVIKMRPAEFWDKAYDKYLSLIQKENKNDEEAVNVISDKYSIDPIRVRSALRLRGRKTKTVPRYTLEEQNLIMEKARKGMSPSDIAIEMGKHPQGIAKFIEKEDENFYSQYINKFRKVTFISEEEANSIMQKIYQGESVPDVAKEMKRTPVSIINVIKREDKAFYNEKIRLKPVTSDISFFVTECLVNKMQYPNIKSLVKERFNFYISDSDIDEIELEYLESLNPKLNPEQSQMPYEEIQGEQSEEEYASFGGMRVKTMSPEEYVKRRERLLTKEKIEEMKRLKEEPRLASSLNWYKKARSEQIKNKVCMFCGKPLGDKPISSWYGGCHEKCLTDYNQRRIKR